MVASICNNNNVLHFLATWLPSSQLSNPYHNFTINLFPRVNLYSGALKDIVEDYGWRKFTIIYQNKQGLERLNDILQNHGANDAPVSVRRIPADPTQYRYFLKELHKTRESLYIIDANPEIALSLLKVGQSVGFIREYMVNNKETQYSNR